MGATFIRLLPTCRRPVGGRQDGSSVLFDFAFYWVKLGFLKNQLDEFWEFL